MFGTRQRFEMGKVINDANAEAQRTGDRRVGTEHITLALLADPGSSTAQALGVTLEQARDALQLLDNQALGSVGITVADPGPSLPPRKRVGLTPGAVQVFKGLRKEHGVRPLQAEQVLLGLLERRRPDPAAELIDTLGVDRGVVRERLRAS